MTNVFERKTSAELIVALIAVSVVPFLAVSVFREQLYTVIEISPYLVFHNVAEFFSVMVSFSIFGLGWYAYDQSKDKHSLFLGVVFLAIGMMDFMHTIGYAGMPPLITANSPNKASQFWIAVRFFGAISFLASVFVATDSSSRLLSKPLLMAGALSTSAIVFIAVIFFPDHIPATFVQGVGLTPFKNFAEYIIVILLIVATVLYWKRMKRTGDRICFYYLAAFLLCILSELVFTLYKSAFDTYNMLGHIYKTVAFMIIYKGIFVTAVRKPYEKLLVSTEELRANRNMSSNIMNSIPQAIFWKDRNCNYLGCNQVFTSQAGISDPDAIIGRSDFDLPWSREETEGYRADDREVMESGVAKFHIIERQSQADGSVIWLDTTKIPLTDSQGNITGVLGVYEDITARRQAEEELKETLIFNQQIIDGAREGIIVYDRELRYRVWNPFMEQLSGLPAKDVLGKTPLEVFPFLKEVGVMERLNRVIGGEVAEPLEFPFDLPDAGKFGWCSDSSAPMLNSGGEIIGVIATVRDTTENRKTEEQLRQSQKMEALGQLAGGVAHDFNNMLQVIMGYSTLLKMDATPGQCEKLSEVLAASERAAELTSGLLSYSRKQVFKIEATELGLLIGGVEKFLRRILGEDISLSVQRAAVPLPVAVDRAHIQQVFINLATNARDAMPSGGVLSLTMEQIEMGKDFVQMHGFGVPGQYALVTVSDTGSGIAKEHLQKIFEPFFTTKGIGSGTGLGLSIVYGIITQHNGYINCYSEEGEGTIFRIYLPLCQEIQPSLEPESSLAGYEKSCLTVLLAEDDTAVRTITRTVLELHGCSVLEASNGKEAIKLFREHQEEINIVLLDALMPELNGSEALEAIRAIKPDTKALFMSGYAREIISGKMVIPEDAGFINKPVLPAKLIETIKLIVR